MSVGAALAVGCVCVVALIGASLVFGRKLDRVSERLGLSEGLHGILTALGADAPEIATAVAAILASHEEAGVGVVIGASTFNLAALLGLSAVVAGRVAIHRHGLLLNGGVGLAVVGVGVALVLGGIGATPATVLILAVLVPYVVLLSLGPGRVRGPLGAAVREEAEDMRTERVPPATLIDALEIVPCLVVIVAASVWLVKATTDLGDRWGVSDVVVGTLVLAGLTTLPNVVTAVRLALHGRGAAVVSEAFNSNSLNILFGLAIPSLFLTLGGASGIQAFTAWWLLGMTAVAVVLAWSGRGLARIEGASLILLYVPFVILVAVR
jgi:cation:H+ antiporter